MATGHASENALYVALPCSTCPIKKALSLRWQTYGLLEDIPSLHSFMCFLILFIEKTCTAVESSILTVKCMEPTFL